VLLVVVIPVILLLVRDLERTASPARP
jgi:hypothetical protein